MWIASSTAGGAGVKDSRTRKNECAEEPFIAVQYKYNEEDTNGKQQWTDVV